MHDWKLPGRFFGPANLVELLRHRAECQPEATAFCMLLDGETEETRLSYGELDRRARAIAAWLESLDLVGQRALLCYPPSLEFIAAFFGCMYAKVVAVPVYPPRRNLLLSRIEAIARCSGARAALTTEEVIRRVEPVARDVAALRQVTWLATCRVPRGIEDRWERQDVPIDTLAFLQYTSGSTGSPKGVMLTHGNLLHNSALIAHVFEHTRSSLGVFWLPAYHDMGLVGGILQPLYVGRPNVMLSPITVLQKPYRWLGAISRYRATTSGGPNFAYELCVRRITPEQRATLDLSSWRVAFNGAEPIRAETLDCFAETFAPCGFRREAFYPCYGLAESTLIVSGGHVKKAPVVRAFDREALAEGRVVASDRQDAGSRALVGCGGVLPDEEVLIVDPGTRRRCAPDRIGEIWVRGPSVARGYWRQPEATCETFQARVADGGDAAFLRTGDLGFFADGELFVTGRMKDLLIVHGVNHHPHDVERTVEKSHPQLRSGCGAVFAVDEGDGRQRLVAVQEIERRAQADFPAIFEAIRRAVAAEHGLALDAIVLLRANRIPKTSSGKIQRFACRDAYLEGSLATVAAWHASDRRRPGPAGREAAPVAATPRADDVPPHSPVSHPKEGTPMPTQPAHDSTLPQKAQRQGPRGAAESTEELARQVLEEVVKVGKDRAAGLTIDSSLLEIGLDSIERMEIMASVEDRFGCRFSEETMLDVETCRDVAEAVQAIRSRGEGAEERAAYRQAGEEIAPDCYRIEQFPEYLSLKRSLSMGESMGLSNPYFRVHEGPLGGRTWMDGREMINFTGYNYLGMADHPAVVQAVKDACDRYGTSASASRLASGETPLHRDLEAAIAGFLGAERAMTLSSGHSTNESIIGHLMGPQDLILYDALAHNSIIQGAILSGARRRPFEHNDPDTAEQLLDRLRHHYRRVLIVIEGVYSMDGDIAAAPRFVELRNRYKTLLMIDEAHSIGTLGARGHGITEHYGIEASAVDVWMGTLSKAFGSCGGYIAGKAELIEYLRYTAPAFVFGAAVPPPVCAASLASIRGIEAEPERVEQLRRRAALFLDLARERGMNTGFSRGTPVVPVILGNSVHSLQISKTLYDRGINVQPILYPAVEESAARLRFFINAMHREDDIRRTIDVLAEDLEKLDPAHIGWKGGDGSRRSRGARESESASVHDRNAG